MENSLNFLDNENIRISLCGGLGLRYEVQTTQGKAIKIKLHNSEYLPNCNSSSFWIPISSLIEIRSNNDYIRCFKVKEWFKKVARRETLISLGKKM